MNNRSSAVLFMMMVSLQTIWGQRLILHMANNERFVCNVSRLDSITFDEIEPTVGEEHEWVDLELPSGTLWATCNVGANSPEEYGDYFAWGETDPKSNYRWSTYKHCEGTYTDLTKYIDNRTYGPVDNKTELDPEDDAATTNWDKDWQMPSDAQLSELINSGYTIIRKMTQNGKVGILITSKRNEKSLFLPASGCREGTGIDHANECFYWSRSLADPSTFAKYLWMVDSMTYRVSKSSRYVGGCVRPVRK